MELQAVKTRHSQSPMRNCTTVDKRPARRKTATDCLPAGRSGKKASLPRFATFRLILPITLSTVPAGLEQQQGNDRVKASLKQYRPPPRLITRLGAFARVAAAAATEKPKQEQERAFHYRLKRGDETRDLRFVYILEPSASSWTYH